jgi:hypothetical protein
MSRVKKTSMAILIPNWTSLKSSLTLQHIFGEFLRSSGGSTPVGVKIKLASILRGLDFWFEPEKD